MTKRTDPWFKFYPADWRGEASLRAVSMAARGLWIEMLCLMHEAEPRGHLLLNGRPVTDAQLAALAGVPVDIAQALLGELETAGTFSRTRAGVIYSRRMRKDTAVSSKQRANVEKRWSKEPNSSTAQDVDISAQKQAGITKPDTTVIPKMPEARDQKERKPPLPPKPAPPGAREIDQQFEEFWRVYPSRGKFSNPKHPAREKFTRLVKQGVDPAAIIAGAAAYARKRKGEDIRFTSQALSWLNKHCWQDEAEQGAASSKPSEPTPPKSDDEAEIRLQYGRRRLTWLTEAWGPPPGAPGCLIPEHLLRPDDGQGWDEWKAQAA